MVADALYDPYDPNRPKQTPELARLAAILAWVDEWVLDRGRGVLDVAALACTAPEAVTFAATRRAAKAAGVVSNLNRRERQNVATALAAAWLEAFIVGVIYERRDVHDPLRAVGRPAAVPRRGRLATALPGSMTQDRGRAKRKAPERTVRRNEVD